MHFILVLGEKSYLRSIHELRRNGGADKLTMSLTCIRIIQPIMSKMWASYLPSRYDLSISEYDFLVHVAGLDMALSLVQIKTAVENEWGNGG